MIFGVSPPKHFSSSFRSKNKKHDYDKPTRTGPDRMLDVRDTPCSNKHGLIIQTFVDLKVGEQLVLRNGHDPVPLRYQFEAEFPDSFTWEHVHNLPEDVAVRITKLNAMAGATNVVANSCGNH